MIRGSQILVPLFAFVGAAQAEFATPDEGLRFFEEKIRPVLAEKCYSCHSSEAKKLKGSLQVDHLEHLLSGGDTGPSLVAGKPDESLLVEAISYGNPDLRMPPKEKLAPAVVDDFKKWIAGGAPWPKEAVPQPGKASTGTSFDLGKRRSEHWCWRPVTKPEPPAVKDASWPRSPIDRFILARVEAAGLGPAAPAEDRIWLRRVHFDLVGLPPTPEQIRAFLKDTSSDRREKVVDALLASPHFGEKWARHWMDLVRYAETHGHEFDYPIAHATEYRDYLIRAFNDDVPFDLFAKEHVAGDLLSAPRMNAKEGFNESVLGTGFWYLNEATHSPTDVLADESDHQANQIDVYGKAFLGLTVSCARCHDHKFDAISTADYYALTGYLHSSARTVRSMDPEGKRAAAAARQRELLAKADAAFRLSGAIDYGRYLTVASGLVRGSMMPASPPASEVIFDDFEDGFKKWTVIGDAFGSAPVTAAVGGQKPITGISGEHFANSFATSADKSRGSLRSSSFVIEKPFVNFLIGGGRHRSTALELHVDGKVERTASGTNLDVLRPVSWDVSPFLGKQAEILLVDEHEGGWGHMIADRITFSDHPSGETDSLPMPPRDAIVSAAAEHGLNPDTLTQWCRVFGAAKGDGTTGGAFLASSVRDPASLKGAADRVHAELARIEDFRAGSKLFANFETDSLPAGWSLNGEGFAPTGLKPGYTLEEGAVLTVPGTVSSSRLGEPHSGALRSPTFEISTDQIHVRLRGRGGMMRVVIDNYHMAEHQPLLFRGTIHKAIDTKDAFTWISFDADLKKYRGHRAYLEFVDEGPGFFEIDEIRFSDTPGPGASPHPLVATLASVAPSDWAATLNRSVPGNRALAAWMAAEGLVPAGALGESVEGLLAEGRKIGAALPPERFALTMAEGTPENARVYGRGSYRSPGEEVPHRFLTALGGREGNRLALAEETVAPDNPLTSRVAVNRIWHHLMGRGIVASVDDFGPMGQAPSHPELLDWLASDFVANGWSLKHTIRTIVLSSTYAQASAANPGIDPTLLATADPTNLLLHRMPVRRLTAEAIRDGILAVSGSLDPALYGPSVPTHRTDFMSGRGARASGPLDGNGRRTIYGSIYRNFLPPLLMTFDMPNPFGPKGARSISNVPAQALALMNDPFVADQAQKWADRVLADANLDDTTRIALMVETVTGNTPDKTTLETLAAFLDEQSTLYGARDKRVWSDLAHVLFNQKDFIYLR